MKYKILTQVSNRMKEALLLTLVILTILTQTGCDANLQSAGTNWTGYSRSNFLLDTVCDITIFGVEENDQINAKSTAKEQEDYAASLINEGYYVITNYEKLLSKTIETSDVSRINHAKGQPVKVDKDTIEVIEKGINFCELSEGKFDITVGKATDLWNFGSSMAQSEEQAVIPEKSLLQEAVMHVDYRKIVIDKENQTVQLLDPEMELDLGGIAKGYIADKTCQFLESKGVVSAIVNLGGNIVAIGDKALHFVVSGGDEMRPFILGIKNPLSEKGELLGTIASGDRTIVTSGTYERCFEVDGVKYHHILDPKTGYPIDTDLIQVSIIASEGMSTDCDGLSTSCLALGLEKGMELINSLDNVEAVFIDNDGNVTMTNESFGFELN